MWLSLLAFNSTNQNLALFWTCCIVDTTKKKMAAESEDIGFAI
jgi:hypothetical protein